LMVKSQLYVPSFSDIFPGTVGLYRFIMFHDLNLSFCFLLNIWLY
jgi:hypothetical protein